MTTDNSIVYRLTTPEDYNSVLEFLREHYYPEEPLTISNGSRKQDTHSEVFNRPLILVPNELATCFVAICGEQIVGVSLAGPTGVDGEQKLIEEASHIPGTNWAIALQFLASLERDSNVYEKYKVDKAIHTYGLSVHKKFRGRGIGLKLYEKSMERAKQLGYPLYIVDCTSKYSARLCDRLNMDCVNQCLLADFRLPGSDEQVLFPGEQKTVRSFAKRLL